jgi:TP901 family phage tail tape measure protein
MAGRFSVETTFKAIDNTSSVISKIESRVKSMERGLGGLDRTNAKIWGGLRTTGLAAAGAGTAIGLAAWDVVGSSAALEDSLAKVASVVTPMSGTVADATGRMKDAALGWSKAHRDSATDFLDTSYMMISAGLNEAQALEATRTAMTVATATFGDGREAAALLATVYNNMGDKTRDVRTEMTRLGDVVTKTQQTFQFANLDQLNEGLKYGIPTALQYGIEIDELSTVIGELNNAGLQGSMAGTAFAATMRSMTTGAKALGFAVAKTSRGGFDFGGTLHNIEGKFGSLSKMSDKTRTRFQKAFGDEGFRGLSLMIGKSDELAGNLKKVHDSAGVSKEAQTGIESKGTNRFKIFENNVEALKISIGEGLSPAVDKVISKLFGVTNATGEWTEKNRDLIATGVTKFVDDAIPAIENFGHQLRDGWHDVEPVLRGVGSALSWANDHGISENIVKIGLGFAAFSGGVKLARGGIVLIEGALKGAKAVSWLWDAGSATVSAVKGFSALAQTGPGIVDFAKTLNGVSDAASAAETGIAGIGGSAGLALGPIAAVAAALAGIGATAYNLYALTNESGGLMGLGEDTAGGVAGFLGSGTKSWGVNGFLEGYAKTDDDRRNLEAARAFKGDAPKWTDKSAGNAASDLTGFGRGYGRTSNDYAGAFGIAPAPRAPGPYADGYVSPVAAPQVAPRRDSGSADQARTNQMLQESIKQMVPQLAGALKGSLTINLPKGATAQVSGAPGVVVTQSGGY